MSLPTPELFLKPCTNILYTSSQIPMKGLCFMVILGQSRIQSLQSPASLLESHRVPFCKQTLDSSGKLDCSRNISVVMWCYGRDKGNEPQIEHFPIWELQGFEKDKKWMRQWKTCTLNATINCLDTLFKGNFMDMSFLVDFRLDCICRYAQAFHFLFHLCPCLICNSQIKESSLFDPKAGSWCVFAVMHAADKVNLSRFPRRSDSLWRATLSSGRRFRLSSRTSLTKVMLLHR